MTVCGPVPAERIGPTLIHEHLHLDARPLLSNLHGYTPKGDFKLTPENAAEARWNPGLTPDNYDLTDIDLVVEELAPLVEAGGSCVVDVTPEGMGRSPGALVEISQRTGLHVVMGGGAYVSGSDPDDTLGTLSDRAIADHYIAECTDGVDGSGVRPGILGEIGTGSALTPREAKVLRASAWTQATCGIAISIHLHPWSKVGHAVLDILDVENVPPGRIVLGHLNPTVGDFGYIRSLFERGVYGAFDLMGFDHSLLTHGRYAPSDYDVATTIVQLIASGFADQILLSHDIGVKTRFHRFGGWSYDHVLRHIVPLLHTLGLDAAMTDHLLVENPRSVLALDPLPAFPRADA
jgi:phosphotriesterase-related protein